MYSANRVVAVLSRVCQHVEHGVNSIRDRGLIPTGNKTTCMHSQVREGLRIKVTAIKKSPYWLGQAITQYTLDLEEKCACLGKFKVTGKQSGFNQDVELCKDLHL